MQHFRDVRSLIFVSLFVAQTIGREEQTDPGQLDCVLSLSRKCSFSGLKAGQDYFLMYGVNCHPDSELSHLCLWQILIQMVLRGGEIVPIDNIVYWMEMQSDAKKTNGYQNKNKQTSICTLKHKESI